MNPIRHLKSMMGLFVLVVALHAMFHIVLIGLPDAASRQLGWFAVDAEYSQQVREHLGIDGTPIQLYFEHVAKIARGDLGRSLHGNFSVREYLWSRLKTSLPLMGLALVWLILLPLPSAMWYARPKASRSLNMLRTCAAVGLVPQFLASVLAFLLFEHSLKPLLPVELWSGTSIVMASLSIAIVPIAVIFVGAADTFEDLARAQWVTVARAMGHDWMSIRRFMIKNVLISLRAQLARLCLYMFLGTAFTEMVFGIPGVGAAFITSLLTGDVPVLFGIVLIMGTMVLLSSSFESRERALL